MEVDNYFPNKKVANTMIAEELRPINTITSDTKLMELIVKKQLDSHLSKNRILIDEQSGFRSNHSCETALNLVLSDWKNDLNQRSNIVATFLDLKRAFETVDRNILLAKLRGIGIVGVENNWMASYLTDRKQRVFMCDAVSSEININIGLPQGTILAPLLFILYINDIKSCLKYCKIRLFADDALLMVSDGNINNAMKMMQEDIDNLYVWLCQNKLKLNITKTKFMILTRNHVNVDNCVLKIKNDNIERVNVIKYLGVMIDDKLNFDEHLNYIRIKIAKKIGILSRSTKLLHKNYKIKVYNSIILPHFLYCPSILFLLSTSQMDTLQKLQNRAMRFILQKDYYTSIRSMLNELNWLNVGQTIMLHTMKFIHNIKFGLCPTYLNEKLQYNNNIHNYNTRRREDYRLPYMRTCKDMNCLEYKGLKKYNELPSNIKNFKNMTLFRKLLRDFCKNNC